MLVSMEDQWRIPELKDYKRMLDQFTWANHADGQARCLLQVSRRLSGTLDPHPARE